MLSGAPDSPITGSLKNRESRAAMAMATHHTANRNIKALDSFISPPLPACQKPGIENKNKLKTGKSRDASRARLRR